MRISKRTGDRGMTSLFPRGRVKKDDPRIEICGILDEAISFLGLCKSLAKTGRYKRLINKIQRDLFLTASEISAGAAYSRKARPRIDSRSVKALEAVIGKLEKKYTPKKPGFVIPGKNSPSAVLDIARCIVRRAERRAVAMKSKKGPGNPHILAYLNRLSDLLYLMARSHEKKPQP